MSSSHSRAVVAMSGGVDSSVAAALLKQQGYDVIGMMLRLWSEPGSEAVNRCCTPDAMALARRVAARLSIPFYAVDAQQVFRDRVVQYFLDGYLQGENPNPCLVCNRYVRWGYLLKHALAVGADFMATGHYARLHEDEQGRIQLLKGVDVQKDQSYVLSVLNQEQLTHTIFPLGDYTKPQVRQLARQFDLPVAERADSQDLCFLGNDDYRSFLIRYAPQVVKPGLIETRDGRQLGQHRGLAFYTIGQRKGLGLASSAPLYVLNKDTERNVLVVGRVEELGKSELFGRQVHWVSGETPSAPMRAGIKIRYKAVEAYGIITPLEVGRVHIYFDEPLRDITAGQGVVFYQGEVCLGNAIITD